jgi:TonB-linked SusC/RagA family outer membrane protein
MYTNSANNFCRYRSCVTKFLLVMKLIIVLMVTGLLQVSATTSNAQSLSLVKKNITVKQVFREIRKQTGYNVLWEADKLQVGKTIDATFSGASLEEVMGKCLEGKNLSYTVEEKTIIIKARPLSLLDKLINFFQSIEITGKVLDEKGITLPNASILIKGTKTYHKTDENGNFKFSVADEGAILVVSYLGYKTQEVPVPKTGQLNIALQPDQSDLEDVVVVGYGTQKKANLTGAVDAITSKQLENRPIPNLGSGLQGLIPNLNISIANGRPNTAPDFNVRGFASINGNGAPLILVDNVPFSASELLTLNPADIESVSVLKDAAASAIYGARAPFGVVLMVTKSAKSNKLNVSLNSYTAYRTVGELPELVTDPYEVLKLKNEAAFPLYNPAYSATLVEAARLRSLDPSRPDVVTDPTDPNKWFYIGSTDWLKEAYESSAPTYNVGVNISKKADQLSYYLSANYYKQKGMIKGADENNNIYNLRGKVDLNITKWLTLSNNTMLTSTFYEAPTFIDGNYFWNINRTNVTDIPRNPDGSWTSAGASLLGAVQEGGRKTLSANTVQTTFSFDGSLIKNIWSLKGDATFRRLGSLNKSYEIPVPYKTGPNLSPPLSTSTSATNQNGNVKYEVVNLYTQAQKQLGSHFISGLVGYNQEHFRSNSFSASRKQLISNGLPSLNLATGDQTVTESVAEWAVQGLFYRVNYNFKERYLLELNGRYDGSSRFAPGRRWTFVPSASAGWMISQEKFFAPVKELLAMDMFKVRGSYGILGNQAAANEYDYFAKMSSGKTSQILGGSQPTYVNPPAAISSNFTWEKVSTVNFGADLSFFKNRLEINFDRYTRFTKNMLVPGKPLPGVFGTASPTANAADLKTKGWELKLGWKDQVILGGSPLSYNVVLGVSDSRSYITRFDNPNKLLSNYYEGMEIGEIWGLEAEGFFQNADELKNHAYQTAVGTDDQRYQYFVGDMKFKDRNNDGKVDFGNKTVDNPGDYYKLGNNRMRLPYSIDLSGAWKGFDLRVFVQGVAKRDWYAGGSNIYFWGIYAQPWTNVTVQNLDHWSPENPNAYFPRIKAYAAEDTGEELGIPNTRFLQDASYLRVKNITLGYTLPKSWLKKAKLENVHFYISGENLFEHSNLKVKLDPEGLDGNIYPFQRTYSFGVNFNF